MALEGFSLQMTFRDIDHLIEPFGNMIAQGRLKCRISVSMPEFFIGEILLIGKSELQFISVIHGFCTTRMGFREEDQPYRSSSGDLQPASASLQPAPVGNHLPGTTPANAKMPAKRLYPAV